MRERPILFSAPMVRAILSGAKTQTRRLLDPQPFPMPGQCGNWYPGKTKSSLHYASEKHFRKGAPIDFCPYGKPGDRLWVREAWAYHGPKDIAFKASPELHPGYEPARWRPSIHMPRWASRLALEITEVRVQRLQEISEEDAYAEGTRHALSPSGTSGWGEGVYPLPEHVRHLYFYRRGFQFLWDSLAKPGSDWAANPWVWAITFKVLGSEPRTPGGGP